MSAKHTPGPWKVGDIFPLTVTDHATKKIRIALVYDHNGPDGTRICKANARLISLAPVLVEAVRRLAACGWKDLDGTWTKCAPNDADLEFAAGILARIDS